MAMPERLTDNCATGSKSNAFPGGYDPWVYETVQDYIYSTLPNRHLHCKTHAHWVDRWFAGRDVETGRETRNMDLPGEIGVAAALLSLPAFGDIFLQMAGEIHE